MVYKVGAIEEGKAKMGQIAMAYCNTRAEAARLLSGTRPTQTRERRSSLFGSHVWDRHRIAFLRSRLSALP